MMRSNACGWLIGVIAVWLVAALPPLALAADSPVQQQQQRQLTQPLNNAPVWREVRSGKSFSTTAKGVDTGVLINSSGQTWRAIREGPLWYWGGIVLLVVLGLIILFYLIRGTIKLKGRLTGREILRFTDWDRVIHWATAISFVILAVSGLIMLFGKHLLLSWMGYVAFSWLAIISKTVHNFVGPVFVLCTVLIILTFIRDNLPKAYDWKWLRTAGGMLGGREVPSGKFNAGEKAWFWGGVLLLGIIVSITGLILDFPNFGQGRDAMQIAHVLHVSAAVIFMAISLGHIYLGTLGMQGTYHSMRHGTVDETWAKEHHEYWYDEVKAGPSGTPGEAGGAHPAAQPER
jgi:formate dehydrogenase subunit gamma